MTNVRPDLRQPAAKDRPVLLVLTSTYPRWQGDPEPGFVHELAKRLTGRFRVVVLGPHAPGAPARDILDGVEVHRYRYAPQRWETLVNDGGIVTNLRNSPWKLLLVPGFVFAQAISALRLCRRLPVDVIHAHWLIPQGLIAAFWRLVPWHQAPFVVTSHGADLYALNGRLLNLLKRFVCRRAAAVTVVSREMQDELDRIGVEAGKSLVQPMGVDLMDRFKPVDGVRNEDELLFVGRLVRKKGLHVLLEAMPLILRERPRTRLTVAGFGPEEESLRRQARDLGVEAAVDFLGAVPQAQLPELYRRAALFVAPFVEAPGGDREGLGLVTVEAIACGCPVVVGDLPAVRDVVGEPDETTMLVRPGDSVALAQGVLRSMSEPEATADHAGRLRERLVARFDWGHVAKSYEKLLLRALSPS